MREMACITYFMWGHGQAGSGFECQQILLGFKQHNDQFKPEILS